MPNLSNKDLAQLKVAIPPIELQSEYLVQFDKYSCESQALQGIYTQKLSALSELKQSILQQAFSGELTGGSKSADRTL